MAALLPPKNHLRISYQPVAELDTMAVECELTLLLINEKHGKSLLRQCQRSLELLKEYERQQEGHSHAALRLNAQDKQGAFLCIFVKEGQSAFSQLQTAAKAWKEAAPLNARSVALATLGFKADDSEHWLNALLAAALATSATLPNFKAKMTSSSLQHLALVTDASPAQFAVTLATQAGNNLARWFTAQPPNLLTCGTYRQSLQTLAERQGWQAEFLNLAALRKHKAGAFLAVARANAHSDAGILHLSYRSKAQRHKRKLCLVGKGICFDTGGINLKSHKGMYDMHTDMQGSAVAVGTLLALSQLKVPYDIDCWLALTENEIGPNAYRPQEVITAANGTTIQVVHSDAEGRMALADTLTLAAKNKPALMIDFATLTGACVAALTERMSGAFSNRDTLRSGIETAGRDSGERIWNFPMDADFDSDLESSIADLMQCTLDNKGDHILAARFLNHFVPNTVPWIHIDLSSASKSGGLAHIPTEITGFGVRWAVEFVTRHAFT